MSHVRTFIAGTTEYLEIPITADVTLNAQPVSIRFGDDDTWHAAEWVGTAGTKRTARILLDGDGTPVAPAVALPALGTHRVCVKIADSPEAPILHAGSIRVVAC